MKPTKKPGGADLRAMRDARVQSAPASEAERRESSFLRNVAGAGEDLEWILFNQAWTELGFEHVGDWWEQRVLPVLVHLDLRPSVALADRVIEAITADEAGLPSAQRRTQREIANIARTSQSRVARSRAESNDSGADLGVAANPEANVPGLQDAIDRATTQDTPVDHPPAPDAPEVDASQRRTGDDLGQPEVDRQDSKPGEADEGADLSAADGGGSPSATTPPPDGTADGETGAEDVAPRQSSDPVDGREQGSAGVTGPALDADRSGGSEEQGRAAASVPAPGKVARNEALTKWALDTPEGRALAKRAHVIDWMSATWEFLDEVGPDVFVAVADGGMHEDMRRALDAVAGWHAAMTANSGIRLVKGAAT